MDIKKEEFLAALKFAFSNGFMKGSKPDCKMSEARHCFNFKEIDEEYEKWVDEFLTECLPGIKVPETDIRTRN